MQYTHKEYSVTVFPFPHFECLICQYKVITLTAVDGLVLCINHGKLFHVFLMWNPRNACLHSRNARQQYSVEEHTVKEVDLKLFLLDMTAKLNNDSITLVLKHPWTFLSSVFSFQATDGDIGTFGSVRYYFSDEPDQ